MGIKKFKVKQIQSYEIEFKEEDLIAWLRSEGYQEHTIERFKNMPEDIISAMIHTGCFPLFESSSPIETNCKYEDSFNVPEVKEIK